MMTTLAPLERDGLIDSRPGADKRILIVATIASAPTFFPVFVAFRARPYSVCVRD
jgi:hypothetical protein